MHLIDDLTESNLARNEEEGYTDCVTVTVTEELVLRPLRPRAHHRVNPYILVTVDRMEEKGCKDANTFNKICSW